MNEFVARNGLIALDNSTVTGSLNVTNGITGSLLGTASFATTASFALNAGGAAASSNLIFSGSVTASVDVTANTFRLISGSSTFLYVSSSGRVGLNTTTPSAQLEIRKSAQAVPNIVLSGPNNYNAGDFKGLGITNYYSDVTTTNRQLAIYNTDNTNYPYFRVSISNINYVSVDAITGSTSFTKDLYLGQAIYITSGSNVGIGTLVPSAKLQVSGTVNVANIRGSGSATTQSIFTVDGAAGRLFSVNDSLSGSLFSVNTIAGLPVVEAFSDNTVRIGQYGQRALFVSQSRVGIGTETTSAKLQISGSNTEAILQINSPASSSILVVSGSGNIGIGTASPGAKLEIRGGGSGTTALQIIENALSGTGAAFLSDGVGTNNIRFELRRTADGLIQTQLRPSTDSYINALTGNLGIGTASPLFTLDVSGSGRYTNGLTVTGSLTVFSGSFIDFQVTDTGTKIGADLTDTHIMTGSLSATGSITGTSIIKSGGTSTQVLMADGSVKSNPTGSVVATSQTTISTAYTDLATAGPTVTVTIGASGAAIVILTARTNNTNSGVEVFMGFAVSGGTTVAASDAQALCSSARNTGDTPKNSAVFWVTGLNAGSNTFTSKYRASANTATFVDRNIIVIPI